MAYFVHSRTKSCSYILLILHHLRVLIAEMDSSKSFLRPVGDEIFPTPNILIRPQPVSIHWACFTLPGSLYPLLHYVLHYTVLFITLSPVAVLFILTPFELAHVYQLFYFIP
jgi:hypothetical protein